MPTNLTGGAYLSVASATAFITNGYVKLGDASSSSGFVTQSGGTVAINGTDGTRALAIGEFPNETSSYTLTGGSLSVPNGPTYAPWNGSANLTISNGSASLKGIIIGQNANDPGFGNITLTNGLLSIGSLGITNPASPAVTANVNLNSGTLAAYANWSTTVPDDARQRDCHQAAKQQHDARRRSGTGGLAISSGGVLGLGGNTSSFSGGTSLNGGTLQLGGATGLGTGGLTVSGGGIVDLANFSPSIGGVTLTSGTITSSIGTPTLTGTSYAVQSGLISVGLAGSTAAFSMTGTGLVTLSGSNSYGGGATIGGGTLAISSEANLGTAPLYPRPTVSSFKAGATLRVSSGFVLSANRGIGLGDSGATINLAGGTLNYSGVLRAPPSTSVAVSRRTAPASSSLEVQARTPARQTSMPAAFTSTAHPHFGGKRGHEPEHRSRRFRKHRRHNFGLGRHARPQRQRFEQLYDDEPDLQRQRGHQLACLHQHLKLGRANRRFDSQRRV